MRCKLVVNFEDETYVNSVLIWGSRFFELFSLYFEQDGFLHFSSKILGFCYLGINVISHEITSHKLCNLRVPDFLLTNVGAWCYRRAEALILGNFWELFPSIIGPGRACLWDYREFFYSQTLTLTLSLLLTEYLAFKNPQTLRTF